MIIEIIGHWLLAGLGARYQISLLGVLESKITQETKDFGNSKPQVCANTRLVLVGHKTFPGYWSTNYGVKPGLCRYYNFTYL